MRASPPSRPGAAVTLLAVTAAVLWAGAAQADTTQPFDLNMTGHRVKNVGAAAAGADVVTLGFVTPGACTLASSAVNGAIVCAGSLGSIGSIVPPLSLSGSVLSLLMDGTSVGNSGGVLARLALTGAITSASGSGSTAFGAAGAHSVLMNATGGSAAPTYVGPGTSGQFLGISGWGSVPWTSLTGLPGLATDSTDGFESAGDKTKLDGLVTPVLAGDLLRLEDVAVGACVIQSSASGAGATFSCAPDLTVDGTSVDISGSTLRRLALTGAITSATGSAVTAFGAGPTTSLLGVQGSSAPRTDIACSGDGQVFWDNAGAVGCAALPYAKLTGAPAGLPPTGSATGDLGGSYPGPTVLAAEFGAQRLTFGTTPDGSLLKRSGTTVAPAVSGTDYVVTVRADGIATGTVQLASLSAANMVDGAIAWVDSVGDYFRLGPSTLATTATTVVTASGKAGYQWIRLNIPNRGNWTVATWYIDPVSGNDENNGTTSGTALKTNAEWTARLIGGTVAFPVVNILNDVPDADSIALPTNGGDVTFAGVEHVLSTQTVTSAQARTPASNLANEITVTGFNWTPFLKDFVRVQGTNNYAAITKVIGTGVVRLGELWDTVSSAQAASGGIGAGAVIEIVKPTKGPLTFALQGRSTYFVTDLAFDGSGQVNVAAGGVAPVFRRVIFGGTSLNLTATSGYLLEGGLASSPSALFAVGIAQGTAFTSTTLAFQNLGDVLANMKIRSPVFQGTAVTLVVGMHVDGDLGQFDIPASTAGIFLPGTSSTAEGAILTFNSGRHYGTGDPTASMWKVGNPTLVVYSSATPPTNTAGLGVQINGANVALASLPYPYSPFHGNGVINLAGGPASGTCTNCTVTTQNGVVTAYSSGSAGITAPGSNGIMTWTGSAVAARTLTNGDGTVNFSNPDGVAGNPEIHVNAIPESKVTNLVTDLTTISTAIAGKQATGNYLTGLASAVTATGPGTVNATVHLDAGSTVQGLLPLGNLVNCATGQIVGMIGGVEGCVTPTAGTVYTGHGPITVTGSAIDCPACLVGGGLTNGSVLFWNGGLAQDNAGFFYDSVNHRLGVGTVIPSYPIDIVQTANGPTGARTTNLSTGASAYSQFLASNDAGELGYFGVAGTHYSGFGPFNGGSAYVGSYSTQLSVFTQLANPIVFYTNSTPVGQWTVGGGFQVFGLSAGGITKAAATTGELGIASAADVAAAITWPASPRVLISGGISATPVGDATFTFDTPTHTLSAFKLNVASTTAVGDLTVNGAMSLPLYGSGTGGIATIDGSGNLQVTSAMAAGTLIWDGAGSISTRAAPVAVINYAINGALNSASGELLTSSTSLQAVSLAEYPIGFLATTATLSLNLESNSIPALGSLSCTLTRSGSLVAGGPFLIFGSSSTIAVHVATLSTGSSSANDTYGLYCTSTVAGGNVAFAARLAFQ